MKPSKEFVLVVGAMLVVLGVVFHMKPSVGQEKVDPNAVYSYKDGTGVMVLGTGPCPYIDPKESIAEFFHEASMFTMQYGPIPACWAIDKDGLHIILLYRDPLNGQVSQLRGPISKLKREGAPIPKKMGDLES